MKKDEMTQIFKRRENKREIKECPESEFLCDSARTVSLISHRCLTSWDSL